MHRSVICFVLVSLLVGTAAGTVSCAPVVNPQNGHLYEAVVVSGGLPWDRAQALASAVGGHLATISSQEENDFVYALVLARQADWQGAGPWLGGYQLPDGEEPAGGWVWVTGEPWGFVNWHPGTPERPAVEPNNLGDEDHLCMFHDSNGTWNDAGLNSGQRGYVVEYDSSDLTPPSTPSVMDDGNTTADLASLHAAWASVDSETGIAEYQYAIGTTEDDPGSGYIVGWTSSGTETEATATGLQLLPGQAYYWYVKARNGEGLWSGVGASDGIIAVEPLGSLGEVKTRPPDSPFTVLNLVASTTFSDLGDFIFVQDTGRAAGMRLNGGTGITCGARLSVIGQAKRVDGEWQIDLLEPSAVVDGPQPMPLFMTQRGLAADLNEDLIPESGLDPTGLLVTIAGTITRINTGQHVFYVNDGSNLADGMGPSDWPYVGVRVSYRTFTPPALGKRVAVTGVLRVEKATLSLDAFVNGEYRLAGETLYLPVVCPRTQADIVVVL